jgi:phosphatidylglycerol---prolipoprotein diacylglyceryl transferase
MHFPVSIPIGPYQVNAHWLFEALAYFIGFRAYLTLRRRRGDVVAEDTRWSVIAAAAVGAAIGSKVLYWLEDPALTIANWRNLEFLMGGKTIVGGLVGGWVAVELAKRMSRVTTATGDLFAIPIALGIAIGRIGCFLEGLPDHTYGGPTSLPWGVDFGDGIRRHPTQIYEIVVMLALIAVIIRLARRPHINGDLFKVFMIAYMSWRFVVGFTQPDPPVLLHLQTLQWTALLVVAYYASAFLRRAPATTLAARVQGAS